MEGDVRQRYQLAAATLAAFLLATLPAGPSYAANSGGCGGSLWAHDTGTQVWTDQGSVSAFVQSHAICSSGPGAEPASARSSPPACALWNAVPTEWQFGGVIGDMISASRRQGQAPEMGPPTIPLVNACGGTPTDIVWVHDPCGEAPARRRRLHRRW